MGGFQLKTKGRRKAVFMEGMQQSGTAIYWSGRRDLLVGEGGPGKTYTYEPRYQDAYLLIWEDGPEKKYAYEPRYQYAHCKCLQYTNFAYRKSARYVHLELMKCGYSFTPRF